LQTCAGAALSQVRVNIRAAVNAGKIKRETRNFGGRDMEVIIVPSATLPDGVVMNSIMYAAEEIEKAYLTLEKTPAPAGHPVDNEGNFISALDPEAQVGFGIGAWNENVTRVNGRVFMDKVIVTEVAARSEKGRAVLAAIDAGEPIHTSTGLLTELVDEEGEANGAQYTARAVNMIFDHDAILIGEEGAATPAQGVGMLVNGKRLDVINSSLSEDMQREAEYYAMQLAQTMRRSEDASLASRIIEAVKAMFSPDRAERNLQTNEADMTVSQEQFDALAEKVTALEAGIGETVKNAITEAMAPVTNKLAAIEAGEAAKVEAEKAELVNRLTATGVVEQAEAEGLDLAALRIMANKLAPRAVAPMHKAANAGKAGAFDWADNLPKEA
jgi:hypothetical protein